MNYPLFKKRLKEKYDIEINFRQLPAEEIFRYYVLIKEGIDLGHMAGRFFKLAQEVIDRKNLVERLKEVRSGEVSTMDFETDKDFLNWLENK